MRPSGSSPQWLCGDMAAMDDLWPSSRIVSVTTHRVLNKHLARSVTTSIKTVHDIAVMSPQSNCDDKGDGRIWLSLWLHYVCIILLALCLLSTLCAIFHFPFSICHCWYSFFLLCVPLPISILINVFTLLA